MSQSNALYRDLTCPSCGGPGLEPAGERVVCVYCGAQFAGERSLCANCRHVNRSGAEFCEMCGDPLTRNCPICREKNWVGAEYCVNCGQPLDILEYLYQRHSQSTSEWFNRAREEARVLKGQEDESAQRRSRQLWAIERGHQQARAEAAARQAAWDRRTMWAVATVIAVIVIGLAVASLVLTHP